MTIVVRAEVRVLPEQVDAFLDVADRLAQAAEDEAGTVQYRWFTTDDPTRYVVIEEYATPAAAFAHNEHCAELLEQAARLGELTTIELHGDLGPELTAWIAAQPHAHGFLPLRRP
jgi:quinol monooxygenase YgiN